MVRVDGQHLSARDAPRHASSTALPGWPGSTGAPRSARVPGAGLLPFVGGRGDELPDLELALTGVEVDTGRLADYCRVCGFTLRDALPPTYPHVLAFPLQMRLMADGSFPFPLLGMVHLDNAITQHRADRGGREARPGGPRRPTCDRIRRAGRSRSSPRPGSAGSWSGRSAGTILRRGTGADPGAPREPRPEPVAEDAPAVTEWKLGGDLGRRYAGVSGDRNPIHMHALSAKAFGFPRAIAHGMWSQARCLAQLEGRIGGSLVTRASFGKPLLLPSSVRFAVEERDGGAVGFALRDAEEGDRAPAGGSGPALSAPGGERNFSTNVALALLTRCSQKIGEMHRGLRIGPRGSAHRSSRSTGASRRSSPWSSSPRSPRRS